MLARWERVYESRNGGQSWQARWDGLGVTVEAASLAIDPVAPVVYVGADTGLYRSHGGADWEIVAPAIADQTVLALLAQRIPPTSGGGSVLFVGTTRGIYRSLNGGETVQSGSSESGWGQGLENISVTTLLADPQRSDHLYAGTAYNGVFQSVDWGQTWQPIGPTDLTQDVVEAIAWGPNGDLFIAATSGVWRGLPR
jgi:ligand-binding sensor domain-containing protein